MAHELEEQEGLLSSHHRARGDFVEDMGGEDEGREVGVVVDDVLREAPGAVLDGAVDPVYEAKARVLNKAIQEIGMGRYQWQVRELCFLFPMEGSGYWSACDEENERRRTGS